MYGLLGGSADFDGLGAKEMYAHALALTPANTCAATHVAYQQRRTDAAQAQAQAQAQGVDVEEAGEEAGEEEGEEEEEEEAATLAELSVSADELRRGDGAAVARAVAIWKRHGVVPSPCALPLCPPRAPSPCSSPHDDPRPHAPSHPRTLAPSHPRTLAPSPGPLPCVVDGCAARPAARARARRGWGQRDS